MDTRRSRTRVEVSVDMVASFTIGKVPCLQPAGCMIGDSRCLAAGRSSELQLLSTARHRECWLHCNAIEVVTGSIVTPKTVHWTALNAISLASIHIVNIGPAPWTVALHPSGSFKPPDSTAWRSAGGFSGLHNGGTLRQ